MIKADTNHPYCPTTTIAPYVIRSARYSLRTTYQLAADVGSDGDRSDEEVFSSAVNVVLNWLASKFRQSFPEAARRLESFEVDAHGQRQLACISIPEDGLWTARLVHPDTPFLGRPAVAGRTWTTGVSLHRGDSGVRFGVRVLCASAPHASEPITLTRPRVVVDLANHCGLSECRPLDGQPWMLTGEDDLQALHDLLTSEARTLPVILLTQPDRRQWGVPVLDYLLDHMRLSRQTQGFAHVVCMPMELGYAWTKKVGKVWSAFYGAVRTYQPRLDFSVDSPFAHPRVLIDRILFWRYNGLDAEEAFASFLIDKVQEQAATRHVDWGGCVFLADARSRRAALARKRVDQDVKQRAHANKAAALRAQIHELQRAHEIEIDALKAEIDEARNDAEEFDVLASNYKQEAERLAREKYTLQVQNDRLRTAIRAKTGQSADTDVKPPDTYDDMADWVNEQLAGRLVLHSRAQQGIKKATYEDVETVYRALQLLAGPYRDMRTSRDGAKEEWERGIKELELRFGGSIKRKRAGQHGETYFVRHPPETNRRRFLEFHLRKGSTKDDRFCLAIYFFWDEDAEEVVVGWLPSHLDTRAT